MAASSFLNRAKMSVSGTPGTGTITLNAAVSQFASFAEAGAVNAAKYTYVIEDGNDFEIGQGTYTSSGTTFSRDTVYLSKISGVAGTTKLTLTTNATIAITIAKEDLSAVAWVPIQTLTAANVASLDFTNLDTATYVAFMLSFRNLRPATNSVNLLIRVGTSGTPTWQTTGYVNSRGGDTAGVGLYDLSGTKITLSNDSAGGVSGHVIISDLGSSTFTKKMSGILTALYSDSSMTSAFCAGNFNSTTAMAALRVLFSSGNLAAGAVDLFGIKAS